MKACAPALAPT